MVLLPAVVPDIPEARAALVAARLARKVAPLFGVPFAGSPYGLTWVCDYTKITLREIARGAPGPSRPAAAAERDVPPDGWRLLDRAVLTHRPAGATRPEPLPNEIVNTTLNRFGPDTKAAVVLTAANKLLEPVTAAINDAIAFVEAPAVAGELPASVRLAAWAGLVLEAFRSQPALFAAAVQARDIQRAKLLSWELPTSQRWPVARCELGDTSRPEWVPGGPTSPVDFDVVDATIPTVRLAVPAHARDDASLAAAKARATSELARRWLRSVMELGTLTGDGYVWITERQPGCRVVEAFVPHDPTLHDYLRDTAGIVPPPEDPATPPGGGEPAPPLPAVPEAAALAPYGPLARRAVLIALTTMVRITFGSGDLDVAGARRLLGVLDALERLSADCLDPDDPGAVVTRCRVADMRVELLRQDTANDPALPKALSDLVACLDRCVELADRDALGRSDAAELVRSGNVEVTILLRRHRDEPIPGFPPVTELNERLYRWWDAVLRLMEIDLDQLADRPDVVRLQAGFQLHNYASFLSSRVGNEADLRRGLQLFETYVIPAREVFFGRTGEFRPLLHAYQNVTRATTELARLLAASGRAEEAAEHAARGRAWLERAFGYRYTADLVARGETHPVDEACRFALLAAPALLAVLETGASPAGNTVEQCRRLVRVARSFADHVAAGGGRYGRADEIADVERRLRAYEATRDRR